MILNSHSNVIPDSEGSLCRVFPPRLFPNLLRVCPLSALPPTLSFLSYFFPWKTPSLRISIAAGAPPPLSGAARCRRLTWELGHCLSSPSTCTSAAVCRVASDDVSCCKNSESSRDSPAVIAQLGIDAFRLRCAGSSSVTAVTNDTSYLRMD